METIFSYYPHIIIINRKMDMRLILLTSKFLFIIFILIFSIKKAKHMSTL